MKKNKYKAIFLVSVLAFSSVISLNASAYKIIRIHSYPLKSTSHNDYSYHNQEMSNGSRNIPSMLDDGNPLANHTRNSQLSKNQPRDNVYSNRNNSIHTSRYNHSDYTNNDEIHNDLSTPEVKMRAEKQTTQRISEITNHEIANNNNEDYGHFDYNATSNNQTHDFNSYEKSERLKNAQLDKKNFETAISFLRSNHANNINVNELNQIIVKIKYLEERAEIRASYYPEYASDFSKIKSDLSNLRSLYNQKKIIAAQINSDAKKASQSQRFDSSSSNIVEKNDDYATNTTEFLEMANDDSSLDYLSELSKISDGQNQAQKIATNNQRSHDTKTTSNQQKQPITKIVKPAVAQIAQKLNNQDIKTSKQVVTKTTKQPVIAQKSSKPADQTSQKKTLVSSDVKVNNLLSTKTSSNKTEQTVNLPAQATKIAENTNKKPRPLTIMEKNRLAIEQQKREIELMNINRDKIATKNATEWREEMKNSRKISLSNPILSRLQ